MERNEPFRGEPATVHLTTTSNPTPSRTPGWFDGSTSVVFNSAWVADLVRQPTALGRQPPARRPAHPTPALHAPGWAHPTPALHAPGSAHPTPALHAPGSAHPTPALHAPG
jgi:hypothetical protein